MATYKVGADGKAPKGLKSGDQVVTGGGTYTIKGVNSDGSYSSSKTSGTTTGNYGGSYASVPSVSSSVSSSSGSSNKSSSGSSNGNTVKVDSSGNAPKGLSMGSIVNTAGGDYEIVAPNTQGASYNAASGYWSKPYSVPTANVTQDNKPGQQQSQGQAQNQQGSISLPQGATKVTYQSYSNGNYQPNEGYILNDKTYTSEGKEIPTGSIVNAANGKTYFKGATGGKDITGHTNAYLYGQDENGGYNLNNAIKTLIQYGDTTYDPETGQPMKSVAMPNQVVKATNGRYYDALSGEDVTANVTGATPVAAAAPISLPSLNNFAAGTDTVLGYINSLMNQAIAADPTLTRDQALAMALQQLNPQYNNAMEQAMKQLDINAIKSGFYGQLPTEAIKAQTAGQLEMGKWQAVNELANQLFGQSEETAQNKLTAAQQEQQNKINTMLSLLGIYQNEQAYQDSKEQNDWEKAMAEAGLTGLWNGQPTLDFLKYQKSANSSGGSSSGTGGLTPSLINSMFSSGLIDKTTAEALLGFPVSTPTTQNSTVSDDAYNRYRTAMGRLTTDEQRVKYLQDNSQYIDEATQQRLLRDFGLV